MKLKEKTTANRFKKNWYNNYKFEILDKPVDTVIEHLKELERENIFLDEIVMFFDNKQFTPLYVTKNIETVLGYPQQQFLDWGEDALLKIGTFEDKDFWENLAKWQNDFMAIEFDRESPPTAFRALYGGYCYNHVSGRRKKFLFRSEMPTGNNMQMPDHHIARLMDIEHLLKNDGYWMYYEKFNEAKKVTKFYSKDIISDNFISKREKEILTLITAGMNSQEIADHLYISIDTVKTHRKKMIKKLSAKDTSSLIQLCKLCGII